MLLQIIFATLLITFTTAEEKSMQQNDESIGDNNGKLSLVYLGTPNPESPQPTENQAPVYLKQFYAGSPYSPESDRLTYLEPYYQAEGAIPRLQPQIVFYGPGGQGQPILINPGNPPGNFLIPQGPGPNIILRNNPQGPQGSVFPVAGYPKPAHIPPIEKDAEEIPTNPARIPPLPSQGKPILRPGNKPEKLETFNEPNQPDPKVNVNKGQFPQISPETVGLRPGQRFFVLNGDQIFGYPFGVQPQPEHDPSALRFTNVQPFPQNPPKLLQSYGQPSQILQINQENTVPVSVPNLLQSNLFINPQQFDLKSQNPQQQIQRTELHQSPPPNHPESTINTAQQYLRTTFPVNTPQFYLNPQDYPVSQQGTPTSEQLNQEVQENQSIEPNTPTGEVVQPQVVGQFRFTPSTLPSLFPFKDDFENDAIVVDASFDVPSNSNEPKGSLKTEENSTAKQPQPAQKISEPSMAQAGPQATAIAGPGGVAGSAPRATAIVGKGGLAVSSPQATAVSGTKEDEKKRPVKKNA